ncbi:[Fe-Fe] hydrogenase large subunit C-terminal domain-containing protein [Intestinimonas massiliensis (ex Afouda et al. 2020)]|uniref:[Fe-Fe] hydrogenase large subunit C-terminal domain-containing protein n=1 Tax=Intestinimonas massiliensis (ex Afouda et al. 2020) TaxID=1673721 RepID=UPI00102FF5B7|nr:[Fe-Fe] hydrogenase large subunit C-terminal domain-containing protein [Intestinimonas massiliensis (ex Afouda et al. 2020)]
MPMRHSVVMDHKRCRGCTSCIKCCPTEAIRVRGRKATILPDRCIDCGNCIRVCPHKAIKSVGDSMEILKEYDYCVALPEPALYGQFHHLDNVDVVLNALLKIGFHKVYEVAKAAEMLSDYERQAIKQGPPAVTPQISSSCPTVLRLIRMRFPKLMEHVSNTILPMELAAILARREAAAETGLPPERIGVFAIVPCSSKVTAARVSEGLSQPVLDGAFAIRDIYLRLLNPMRELEEVEPMASAGIMGLGWASCGGESTARLGERCVAVDGIENVIQMLEEIEDGRLPEADFLELSACTQGCVGGCFTVENPYGAKMRMKGLMKGQPVSRNRFTLEGADRDIVRRDKQLQYLPTFVLDHDREMAISKQRRIQELEAHLPGLHCGSCGAPSCHAFAEDVVLGRASVDDCIFKVRERMRTMAGKDEADDYLPPPFRRCQIDTSRR